MIFGREIEKTESSCILTDLGVDASESITLKYKDGRMAVLNCTMNAVSDRRGVVYGPKGYIVIENINNFESVTVYDTGYKPGKPVKAPRQITGYEYEVYSCLEAIEKGEKECWEMPHEETLRIMRQMDGLRADWGVVFPFEKELPEGMELPTGMELPEEKAEILIGEVEDTVKGDTDILA